ncbi:MAG: hypothetical protein D4R68_01090 [Ignavibacteriales bacterium]|nr:MAG: hypothetical protein D4R68_01090 [Ignavibacteriales bacterium]
MIKSRIQISILILILLSQISFTQQQKVDIEVYKSTALLHMNAGRYGEAIDQLNKYITALPQESEGYNLRATCFEKRQQYEYGRLDYRRAIAIETRDAVKRAEYEKNLQRLIGIWYPILNKKIEGHLREIAIDPNQPFNYLEIGKTYKLMEIWDKAEQWYDEYLKRDDNASPDEIIRYTEVLAKTGSIVKGERILKKFTDRYPTDWRLWSRYGYFTMWLGKYQIAIKAFENALGFKPFFKEAQDGLDMATNKAYVTQENPRAFEKEYPIDRYYRILRRNANDLDTRFKLVDDLIQANRLEEAYQQLQIIGVTKSDDTRYKEKWAYVTETRIKTYREKLDTAKVRLASNTADKDALKMLVEYYEYLTEYDSAMVMLNKYFEQNPEEKDASLRFKWARIAAWSREFDKAIEITDKLLQDSPNNLDYQLFRAQVSVWINRDIDLAKQYLNNVLKARPDNVQALVSMGSVKLIEKDFEAAQKEADLAKGTDPTNDDVIKLQSNIDWQKMRFEEEKVYAILEEGRLKVAAEDCKEALPFYEDYLSKAEPSNQIIKEYGDVLFCAKDYPKALEIYNQVLSAGPNYEAQLQRAKLYYAMNDTVNAIHEFKDIVRQDSSDYDANLSLGDSYAKFGEPDSARMVYNNLLDWKDIDSTQISAIKQRKGWLPITGIASIFETFPSYVGLNPTVSYYTDNMSFRLFGGGARLELGATKFLSLGMSFYRNSMRANAVSLNQDVLDRMRLMGENFTGEQLFTTFKGLFLLRFSYNLSLGVGLGISTVLGKFTRDDNDIFFRYEKRDTIGVSLTYQNTDAALILYSPYLIDKRQYAALYKFNGYYKNREGLKTSGFFQYVAINDGNAGNDFNIRLGKYFWPDFALGYEYAYSNYKEKKDYYYSPRNFESHCIWLDNDLDKKENLRVSIGGKIGIIPQSTLVALEGHIDAEYTPIKKLILSGRISIGSTSRDNSSYRFFSGQLSAFWNIF